MDPISRFGIDILPVRVSQDGLLLKVEEVRLIKKDSIAIGKKTKKDCRPASPFPCAKAE